MHAKPERPVPFQGDLRNLPEALAPLKQLPNWVCWRYELRKGKWTKPPRQPGDPKRYAKNNDPSTWGTYEEALAAFEAGQCDGIGFNLLGTDVVAFDIDKCRDPASGDIAPEAMAIVDRATSYTEMTVSGTGLRIIGYGSGDKVHRKQKIPGSAVEVESYRGAERYIVVTGNPLPNTQLRLADIDSVIDAVVAELDGRAKTKPGKITGRKEDAGRDEAGLQDDEDVGDADAGDTNDDSLPDHLVELIDHGVPPQDDLSEAFHHAVCWLGDLGWSASRIEARITGKPIVPERYEGRLGAEIARSLSKSKSGTRQQGWNARRRGVMLDDFYAYMPRHSYIFVPTRETWPGSSVNARVSKVPLFKKNGAPVVDDKGKPKHSKPSDWLDRHKPIEGMTWAPGEPLTISNRLIADGGWIERPGVTTFNLYRPPAIQHGNAADAGRWIELVHRVYPDDADHIIAFCAHRVQHPSIKINHAIILGGDQGIGKDTMLEPLKHGVGPWNFIEVSPLDIMSNYNDYMRCVVLRISEAHDLGDINRYAFYDHMKTITATPPDVVRVNGKYIPQHYVVNVAGVIYTTNHRFDGVFLPPNDRRTYVAWSETKSADFGKDFWKDFWAWYESGGLANAVAYLAEYDLSKFDPKAPPKKTAAFWQIVGVGAAPEASELADALDALGGKEKALDVNGKPCRPVVTTIARVANVASEGLSQWLKDRKNRRTMAHRFEEQGYTQVLNPDAKSDGLWVIGGKRQTVYGRIEVSPDELVKAARELS
jgi:hypothetical protein